MKRNYIYALIMVITVAMIALISIQVYWVSNSFSLKQEEFVRDANDVLTKVSEKLERNEAINQLKSHKQMRRYFTGDDNEAREVDVDSDWDFSVLREITREGNDLEIKFTQEQEGKKSTRIIRKTVEDFINADDDEDLDIINMNFLPSPRSNNIYREESVGVDSVLEARIEGKKALVGDLVKSLTEVDFYNPIEKRLNIFEVDSILNLELKDKGIDAFYRFAVFDADNNIRLSIYEDVDTTALLESRYSTVLFPNDIVQNPYYLRVHFPKKATFIFKSNAVMMVTSFLIILVIMSIFYYSVRIIIDQKRNSMIKNDFVNNMTHELKTPISTISLACEALKEPVIGGNPESVARYTKMISDENKRLSLLVEDVLQSAVFEKGKFKLNLEILDAHKLVESIVSKMMIQINERNGKVNLDLQSKNPVVCVDKVHLSNVIYNLLDNAIKYSKGAPEISILSRDVNKNLKITVQDRGIGIAKENQKQVFEKLYRVPTGNRHDVKGFGLGLNYVKIVMERLGGKITLKSQLGKGSKFNLYIPKHGKKA